MGSKFYSLQGLANHLQPINIARGSSPKIGFLLRTDKNVGHNSFRGEGHKNPLARFERGLRYKTCRQCLNTFTMGQVVKIEGETESVGVY